MEPSARSRKTTVVSVLALLLFLYAGSYCWLRFGVVRAERVYAGFDSSALVYLTFPDQKWDRAVGITNIIYRPLLTLEQWTQGSRCVVFDKGRAGHVKLRVFHEN